MIQDIKYMTKVYQGGMTVEEGITKYKPVKSERVLMILIDGEWEEIKEETLYIKLKADSDS